MPQPNRCEICGEPTAAPIDMCIRCVASYKREVIDGGRGSFMGGVVWAARRARWYAERRAAQNARTAVKRDRKVARR